MTQATFYPYISTGLPSLLLSQPTARHRPPQARPKHSGVPQSSSSLHRQSYLGSSSSWPEGVQHSFTYTRSPLQNTPAPANIGLATHVTNSLPFQLANSMVYIGYYRSLPDSFICDPVFEIDPKHSIAHSLCTCGIVPSSVFTCLHRKSKLVLLYDFCFKALQNLRSENSKKTLNINNYDNIESQMNKNNYNY